MSNGRAPKSGIVEAACRNDFLSFSYWCFQFLEPGSPLNMNWHHEAIAYYLELVIRGVIKRLLIAAPRNFHVQSHMPRRKPRTRVQELHLDARRLGSGGSGIRFRFCGREFRIQFAGANRLDHGFVLFGYATMKFF